MTARQRGLAWGLGRKTTGEVSEWELGIWDWIGQEELLILWRHRFDRLQVYPNCLDRYRYLRLQGDRTRGLRDRLDMVDANWSKLV
jgi:hypothetical protein